MLFIQDKKGSDKMAEFKNIVITKQGQALMAKILSGMGNVTFTRIDVSDMTYTDNQLEELIELTDVKQSVPINKGTKINEAAVKLEAALTNKDLEIGYHMQTIGLYASDGEDEILYGVMIAKVATWMPPFNGVGESCAIFNMYVTVGNTNHVSLDIASGVYATVTMLNEVKDIADSKIDKKADQMLTSLGDSTIFNLETGYYPVSKAAITEAMANAGNAPVINPDANRGYCNVLGAYLTVVKYDKNNIYCNLKVVNDLQGRSGIQLQMKEFINLYFGNNSPLSDGRISTGWIENTDEQLSYGSTSPTRNSKVKYALDTKVNVADVEASLSPTSTNPIQSKAVYQAIQGLGGSGGGGLLTRIWSGNARSDKTSINILVNSDWYYYTDNDNLKVLTLGLNIHRTPAESAYESPKLIFVNIYNDLVGYGGLVYSSGNISAAYVHETLYGSIIESSVSKIDVSMLCAVDNFSGQDKLRISSNFGAKTNYCYITDVFVVIPKDEGGI